MDKDMFTRRLQELKDNYQAGQAQLQRLDAQRNELQQTMLRISGAIQVLEEMLQERHGEQGDATQAAGIDQQALHLAK